MFLTAKCYEKTFSSIPSVPFFICNLLLPLLTSSSSVNVFKRHLIRKVIVKDASVLATCHLFICYEISLFCHLFVPPDFMCLLTGTFRSLLSGFKHCSVTCVLWWSKFWIAATFMEHIKHTPFSLCICLVLRHISSPGCHTPIHTHYYILLDSNICSWFSESASVGSFDNILLWLLHYIRK